jgi:hypothetical protein
MAASKDFTIEQGKTWNQIVRWETSPIVYKAISAITQAAPAQITTLASHGIPSGWRVAVVSVKGMTAINAATSPPKDKDYHVATVISPTLVELNDVNSAEYKTYTSGGYLQYNTPADLNGFTASMSIKTKIGTPVLLQSVAGGTSSTTRPTAAGTDGTVVWVSVTSGTPTTYWKPGAVVAPGAIIDLLELLKLSSVSGEIALDNTSKAISLTISATVTAAFDWTKGVYDLEVASSGATPVVTALLSGKITVTKEVTTTP